MIYHGIIIIAAGAGFTTAFYIRRKKDRREVLLCPLDSDCNKVVHSQYSKLWGFRLENLGLLYYALIGFSHLIFVFNPVWLGNIFPRFLLLATVGAFLFSLYLTFVQAIKLQEWCVWCLISALLCTIIFLSELALIF